VPEEWQAFGDRILTTDSLFEQDELPDSVAVIGLGIIGVEIGQSLHRLGIQVVGVDQATSIAGLKDREVNQVAIESLGREFPLWLGHPAQVTDEGGKLRVKAGENSVLVDRLLVSMGRRPNVNGLGLERLGVELDAKGVPRFDPTTMQVGNLPVFIAGDVTGEKAILHEAGDEGRIAGYNAVRDQPVAFRRKTPLAITFSDPNIAAVGAEWDALDPEATAVGEVRFGPVGRALIMGKNRGLLRVYGDRSTGRLLGAAMIAPKGENLAHALAWAIQQERTVFDLLKMPFYHPVIEEALQAALYNLASKVDAEPRDILELDRM
jgi:dihydrolipoamide dehydrogenase